MEIKEENLVKLLQLRAQEQPSSPAYIWLQDGEKESRRLSYRELDDLSRAIASHLQSICQPGDRALLLYPSGLEFIAAFFGCLYAGVVAVPAYPPKRNQKMSRLEAIVSDAGATVTLTTSSELSLIESRFGEKRELALLKVIATDMLDSHLATECQEVAVSPDNLAFLQYTSGSTGKPKGVMVSHGNLLHNSEMLKVAFGHSEERVGVGWLPLFHDMGLIGNVVQPLYLGRTCILMSPVAFLQKPIRWLQAISRYKATTSGGPNFAYDLCVNKITPEAKATLDLSSWELAFSGAEKVRDSTLERFRRTFAEVGFRKEAFYPCYGLAEATLLVSGGETDRAPVILEVSREALEQNLVVTGNEQKRDNRKIVGCGRAWLDETISIVDPQSLTKCRDKRVGEIWVSSASVARGYWRRPEQTEETFFAYLADTVEGPFLRTGDLGFLQDGELFVTGRLKDLIILRGRNYYPQDIEQTVEQSHPSLRPNCSAAFSVDVDSKERVVVAAEVERQALKGLDVSAVVESIRESVWSEYELQLYGVLLLKTASIPKTSSGKIQRHACRQGFVDGSLNVVGSWQQGVAQATPAASEGRTVEMSKKRADDLIGWLREYALGRINSRLIDERRSIPPYIVLDFGNRGLMGMQVPESYGGLALSSRDMVRVIEHLAAIDMTLATLVGGHNALGIRPLQDYGTPKMRDELLPILAKGRELAALAITEPSAGSNPRGIASVALADGKGSWQLRGTKIWSGSAGWAGAINVFVRLLDSNNQPSGITGFIVRQGTPGLRIGPEALTMGMRGMVQNTIDLEDVHVSSVNLLGEVGKGMEVAWDAFMLARLGIAASSVGGMKRCAQLMHRYATRRSIATGRLLDNPVTLARLSQVTAAITATETLVATVADLLDRGLSVPEEAFIACKTSGPEFLWSAADSLVQLLGGRGYIETNIAPQILRDARLLRIFEGPTDSLNMYLGSRVNHGSEGLHQFLGASLGCKEVSERLSDAAAQINGADSPFSEPASARRWADILIGEVATYGILLAAVRNASARRNSKQLERAEQWTRLKFSETLAQAMKVSPTESVLLNPSETTELISSYGETISDLEQTLPGEDHSLDPMLKCEQTQHPNYSRRTQAKEQTKEGVTLTPTPSYFSGTDRKTPATESLETWLAEWIGRELGSAASTIDPQKSLFYYGLDSVTAMELARDLEERVGRQVSPSLAWDYPTIAALTSYLTEERSDAVWTPTVAPLVGEKAADQSEFPLSSGQKALWFLYKLARFSWAYNIILAVRIRSQVDVVALRGALEALVERHQTLRTTYIERNGSPQQLIKDGFDLPFAQIDASSWNTEELKAHVESDARRPFNLEESAFRVSLFTREASDHVLLLAAHHIASDFWSMLVLMDELKVLYTVPEKSAQKSGSEVSLAPLPLSYTDWMSDQNSMLAGSRGEELWNYWRQELGGPLDAVLDLPIDKPRPPVQTYKGATHSFKLSDELTRQLQQLAQESEATLYTLLLAAFGVLLYRYTGQEDIMVGSPTSGRTRRELSNIVGYLVNPVVLRTDMSGNPRFSELLRQVRQKVAGAIGHQEYPFGLLVEKLQPQRDPSRSPLFDVMFVLQQFQGSQEWGQLLYSGGTKTPIKWGELDLEYWEISQQEGQFDLTLEMSLASGALGGAFKYNQDLFSSGTIFRMAVHFQVLLEAIVRNPQTRVDQLPLLTEFQRHQLLVEWNDTANKYPSDKCIHELFSEQVERTPDAVAVVFEESQLTYRELNARANKLAHYLRSLGVGPEVLVGICVERSLEMVVGLLSILKAGGAYVPLDPNYPAERLAYMLADAAASVLLTQEHLLSELPEHQAQVLCLDRDWSVIALEKQENPLVEIKPKNLAYTIYTSGSTGKPKGVMNTHAAIVNRLLWMQDAYKLTPDERVLQKTPFSFDVSVWEFFWPLLAGGTIVVAKPNGHKDSAYLAKLIADEGVTTLHFVPSMLQVFLLEPEVSNCDCLQRVICSGEALPAELVSRFFERLTCSLHNLYGPTEAAIDVTYYQCHPQKDQSTIPIGCPIANTQIYILDSHLEPVPIGVPGELYIGGAPLARGYLNRPELTLSKFIPHPFSNEPGARLYKTGDLARYRRNGNIEFLGRIDNQVKIRGFRIEPGEIEATLAQHAYVGEAAVIAREDIPGDKRLVAYIVAKGAPPTARELRDFMKGKLPGYMVPAAFVTLEAMPLTPNGKVDRRALPALGTSNLASAETFVAPRTPTEEILAAIWSKILGAPRVGIHDNFFELGGDSILTLGIISQAAREGLKITPKQMFQYQTIAELADVATVVTQTPKTAPQEPVTGVVPLTPIQHWFFDQKLPEPHHYNQYVLLEVSPDTKPELLHQAVEQMNEHHDALRLRFALDDGKIEQINALQEKTVPFNVIDLSEVSEQQAVMEQTAEGMQRSLNLSEGPLMQAALFNLGIDKPGRLLLVIHHLAVDGVSWRILLEDLANAYWGNQLPVKTTSFQDWAVKLTEYAESGISPAELDYWLAQSGEDLAPLPVDYDNLGGNTFASTANVSISLTVEETQTLLKEVPQAYNTQINDVLLTALVQSFSRWTGKAELLVELEGHGREELFEDVDLSRTVGWFTTIFPVILKLENSHHPSEALKSVKEQLRKIPQRGIGYGILRYLSKKSHASGPRLEATPQAEVSFNYLGQFDQMVGTSPFLGFAKESAGKERSPQSLRKHLLEVNGLVKSGALQVNWTYSENFHKPSTVEGLARGFREALKSLIAHCSDAEAGGYTPSDFAKDELSQEELDNILAAIEY